MAKVIKYHEQSLKIARKLGDRYREADALGNLGGIYNDLEQSIMAATSLLEQVFNCE